MAETDVDRLGPVDWMVVEFPGPDFGKGQVAPILTDYVERGLIRILDMLFLQKARRRDTRTVRDLRPRRGRAR